LNREPQFATKLTKRLNKMLEIEIKLSMFFHLQMDRQTKKNESEVEIASLILYRS